MPKEACAVHKCTNSTGKLMGLKQETCASHHIKKGRSFYLFIYVLFLCYYRQMN